MVSTNSNNLGIIIFALSSTFAMNPNLIEEQQIGIEKYIPMKKLNYMPFGEEVATNSSYSVEFQEEVSFENVILEFASDLISKSENLEPEYQEIIEEKFWDMV